MAITSGIPFAEAVEKKATDLAVSAMFRGLKYMFRYKSLVKDFDTKIEELKNEKKKVSRRVEEEKNNGKRINEDVLKWHTDVEEIQKKDKDLLPSFRCIQCLPIPNPVSRLRLGRKAVKNSEIVTKLTASGKDFSDKSKEIAYHPELSEDLPNTDTVFQEFSSREEAFEKLWKQLESEDSLILGIYGMPGVGKTRMMEQIRQKAQGREKKIFNKVTLAVVGSKTFDVIKLQDQLASGLKCKLESQDDTNARAEQLKNSMLNSGKILVIFDDVWGEISVNDIIGTSFDVASSKSDPGRQDDGKSWKGCKVLFTSREKSHCVNNKCKEPVEITTLKNEEALDMFKNTLGTEQTDSPPDESLVQQVCTKCAGLPLIIQAVGKALKFKTSFFWKNVLEQLEDSKIEFVEGINPKVYACLKLSFDNLPKDAQGCLLLCSLLPADEHICIEILLTLAVGSQLVKGGRRRVLAMVESLRSALLLLESEFSFIFRLHDMIRDVTRSIAVKEHAFIFERCDWRLAGNSADYGSGKVMQLELEKDGFNFPSDLECPDLHSLWLVAADRTEQETCKMNIPKFPGGMFSNLRFLVLERFRWQPQLNLQSLNKLEALLINNCNLAHTDVTCFPRSLETLCILSSDLPTDLDFSKLLNLRKLQILGKNDLQMMPNTISSLSRLEELVLQTLDWDDSTRPMLKLSEISKLTCLTSLIIHWRDFEPYQDTSIFHKLNVFDICVGVLDRKDKLIPDFYITKWIQLSGNLQFEGFQNLLERAEVVILVNTDVSIGRIWDSNREAFEDLRMLCIEGSDTMEYLARISLYEIQSIPWQRSSFSKVISLEISGCCSMKYLFNNYVVECLAQLQQLNVSKCDSMEVIVMNEGRSDRNLTTFPKLKSLKLLSLSKLKSFYGEIKDTHMHSSSTQIMDNLTVPSVQPQPLFDEMVAFTLLEKLKISDLDVTISDIWGKNCNGSSFSKLESLKVIRCSGLKNVFQHSPMASHLIMHIKKMHVSSCKMMREIVGKDEREEITDIIVFPELTILKLADLPDLSSFCRSGEANTCEVKFPALVKVLLEDLEINLEAMELGRYDSTCQLKFLRLSCNKETQLPSAWQPQLYNLEMLGLKHCFTDMLKFPFSFRRLKLLEVAELECSTLFSLSVLSSLEQLQVLSISKCSMLQELVEGARADEVYGMDKKTITLFNLKEVKFEELPNLKSLFQGAKYELHLPALVKVRVFNCGLSSLFTCSIMKNLKQLEVLRVRECKLLEGIVADERGTETFDTNNKIITLPQLSTVIFIDLPNFKSFTHGPNYHLHMPALKIVQVDKCGLSTLFTWTVIQKLQKLEELLVWECKLLESIVADEGGTETSDTIDKIITLPQLSSVRFGELPNLRSFIHGTNYDVHMPALKSVLVLDCGLSTLFTWTVFQKLQQLEQLLVRQCKLLESIVADERGTETFDTNDKIITLPQLSSVKFGELPNLKSFIHDENYDLHMPALKSVQVGHCGLCTLFTWTVFQNLQQLEELSVWECKFLESIVADERGTETSDTNDKIITLPQLSSVQFGQLPNLKSFIHGANYDVHMPALKSVLVLDCGLSTLFTWTVFQKLQQLEQLIVCRCKLLESIVAEERGTETSGTNDKIITLPQLSSVKFSRLPNLKSFIHSANYDLHMPALKSVQVGHCGLCNLFTWTVFQKLQQLEELFVYECNFLESIAADERGTETSDTNNKIITLPRLSSVQFSQLPNLRSFIHGANYDLHMPTLRSVLVVDCGLSTLFTWTVFQKLQQLEELLVCECKLLESIVADERGTENSDTNDKIITFCQLSSITIRDLPNLKSFSAAVRYAFDMPKLRYFHMHGCPRVEYFTSLKTSTGLVKVHSELHDEKEFPDLNAYIRQYHKICGSANHQPPEMPVFSFAWSCPWAC